MPCWLLNTRLIMTNSRPIVEALLSIEEPKRKIHTSVPIDCQDWNLTTSGWEHFGPYPPYYTPKNKSKITISGTQSPLTDTPLSKPNPPSKRHLSVGNENGFKRRGSQKQLSNRCDLFYFGQFWEMVDSAAYHYNIDNKVYRNLKMLNSSQPNKSLKRPLNGIVFIPQVEQLACLEDTIKKRELSRILSGNNNVLIVHSFSPTSDLASHKTASQPTVSTTTTQKNTLIPSADVRLPPLGIPLTGMVVDSNRLSERVMLWNDEIQRDLLAKLELRSYGSSRGWLDRIKDEVNSEISQAEMSDDGLKIQSILHTCTSECDCNRYPDKTQVGLRVINKEDTLRNKRNAQVSLRRPRPNNSGPVNGGAPVRTFAWSTTPAFKYSSGLFTMPAAGLQPGNISAGGFCSNALGQLKIRDRPTVPSIPTEGLAVESDLEPLSGNELSSKGLMTCSDSKLI